jgi:flagellar hook-basal body complex protein FliE
MAVSDAVQPLAQVRPMLDGGMALGQTEGVQEGMPFAGWLSEALATHQAHAATAARAAEAFAAGSLDDIHGTMIASKQADIELRVIASVRNKLVDAFNDMMRMSV